ncbi:DNA glycosylase AlkZ-like family protein [Kineosporia babensis]|uniref:Winged helix DNA-binding domain-containing protein n=1 Tax=Kineosporia babensis TaxID=499548 RepID=A0A9X1SXL7_9ACTN|nr:winged helix DNA-binding domain-containing protein [Kineosporia babensis]
MSRVKVSRENVLGYRARAQGLDRSGGTGESAGRLEGLLGIGVQDTPAGTVAAALAVRGVSQRPPKTRIVWTWRGAPHLHLEADLKALATATWPVDDADATRRIANPRIKDGARRGLAAYVEAATAMREIVTEKLPKGEVSRRVSEAVPDDLNYDCEPCRARHISGGLFQLIGAAAGVEVLTEGRSTFLRPLPASLRPKQIPQAGSGLAEMLLRYLKVNGPASMAALAAHTGMTATAVKQYLPPGLVEVETPVGKAWIPEEALDELLAAGRPELVRLLPGGDPWLTVRDRELMVPDPAQHKQVYRVISNPGVVLVNGDVAGTWRAKLGKGRVLEISVSGRIEQPQLLEQEAQLLAPARSAGEARVTFA